jgi:hypothetical protein
MVDFHDDVCSPVVEGIGVSSGLGRVCVLDTDSPARRRERRVEGGEALIVVAGEKVACMFAHLPGCS